MADRLWGEYVPIDLKALTSRLFAFGDVVKSTGIPVGSITDEFCEIQGDCFDRVEPKKAVVKSQFIQ